MKNTAEVVMPAGSPLNFTDELLAETYDTLRSIASRQLARQGKRPSLNTTLIVHEAWLKLSGTTERRFTDRHHYLATAARAMRMILVDHARRRLAEKRGGGAIHVDITDHHQFATGPDAAIISVEDALSALADYAPELETIVECRFYAGLTVAETAQALGLSVRTVERQWTRARTYLAEHFCDARG